MSFTSWTEGKWSSRARTRISSTRADGTRRFGGPSSRGSRAKHWFRLARPIGPSMATLTTERGSMNAERVYDLSDCTDYRQALLARPPRFVRAAFLLLVAL